MRKTGLIICITLLSLQSYSQFNIDSSYSYSDLNKILELARENKDQKTFGHVYYKLAEYESESFSNNEKALEYYTRALQYFKVNGDTAYIYKTNFAIAKAYHQAGLLSEAENLLINILKYYEKNKDLKNETRTLYELSKVFKSRSETDKSLEYLDKTIAQNELLKDTLLLCQILFDKIQTLSEVNEIDSALISALYVFNISSSIKDYESIGKSLYYIGYLNKLLNKYDLAIKYLLKSEEFIRNVPYSETRKLIYKNLADCFAKIEDYNTAYQFNIRYNLLNDSIILKNQTDSYTNLAIKYGTRDKQSSIEVLKIDKQYAEERNMSQRRLLYALGIGLFLVLVAVYFIVRFYNQRIASNNIINAQSEEINARKIRELQDNMKINSMHSVIEGQEIERERIAKDLHDSLGGLLSTIKLKFDNAQSKYSELNNSKEFENAQNLLDTAVEEVRSISRNLQPGSLKNLGLVSAIKDLINRFEAEQYPDIDFQYYQVPAKMNTMIALSVYRIIQELITNTVKHAQAKEILIQLNTEDDELVIQYEDDGVGFDPDHVRKGMGLENIISRITYLHGSISLDTKEGEGISVLIRIKNIPEYEDELSS